MSERAALLALDGAMEKYRIGRDEVAPLIAMKLEIVAPSSCVICGHPDCEGTHVKETGLLGPDGREL